MNRAQALETLRRLARNLTADEAGLRRLLERISSDDQAEALRDALVEEGAKAILEVDGGTPPQGRRVLQGRSKPRALDPQNVSLSRLAGAADRTSDVDFDRTRRGQERPA